MERGTCSAQIGSLTSSSVMRTAVWLLLTAVVVAGLGCGTARRGTPTQTPFEPEKEEIVLGRRVFMEYCNSCHPGGEGGLGPAINNKPLPAWFIRFQVRHGLGAMPAFSDEVISDEELRNVSRYLVRLRRSADAAGSRR